MSTKDDDFYDFLDDPTEGLLEEGYSEEVFSPKDGKNPAEEKRRNARRIRRQAASWPLAGYERTENGFPIGANGPIYTGMWRPPSFKKLRRTNGAIWYFGRGPARKRVFGKSSRQQMRERAEWWREADDSLNE